MLDRFYHSCIRAISQNMLLFWLQCAIFQGLVFPSIASNKMTMRDSGAASNSKASGGFPPFARVFPPVSGELRYDHGRIVLPLPVLLVVLEPLVVLALAQGHSRDLCHGSAHRALAFPLPVRKVHNKQNAKQRGGE